MAEHAVPDRVGWMNEGGRPSMPSRIRKVGRHVMAYASSVATVAAITAADVGLSGVVPQQGILMLYLAAVVVSALIGGRAPALLAAALGILAYDYVFTEPRWTLTVADPSEVIALVMFVAVALVTGTLAARRGEEAGLAEARATATRGLLEFSGELAAAAGIEATLAVTADAIARALAVHAVMLDSREPRLIVVASEPAGISLRAEDMAAAVAAHEGRTRTGAGTQIHPGATFTFLPIVSARRLLAVIGIRLIEPSSFDSRADGVLRAMLDQAAIAIDRALRAQESAEAALLRESERLQAALLSSLSHDFRTPLASIVGAASSLRQLGGKMDSATRDDLLASIEEDAGRLNRFIGNLLDMSRIESGRLNVRREPIDVGEVVERARRRIVAAYSDLTIEVSAAADLPAALGDAVLLEQVIFNLLDNARKYAQSDRPVAVYLREEDSGVTIAVTDQGKGIPAADLERIFGKFYRRGGSDGRTAGTGLGLSIARGFVTAMGGTINAESPASRRRGTRFTIRLGRAPRQ